jgi:hypothetical protein
LLILMEGQLLSLSVCTFHPFRSRYRARPTVF